MYIYIYMRTEIGWGGMGRGGGCFPIPVSVLLIFGNKILSSFSNFISLFPLHSGMNPHKIPFLRIILSSLADLIIIEWEV